MKDCGLCKWMNQGRGSCKCFNPKQTDTGLKDYVYWTFSCDRFEEGKQLNDEQMQSLGYTKKKHKLKAMSGDDISYNYWHKPQSPVIR